MPCGRELFRDLKFICDAAASNVGFSRPPQSPAKSVGQMSARAILCFDDHREFQEEVRQATWSSPLAATPGPSVLICPSVGMELKAS